METVQVQPVNDWWEQVLPVAALLISLFSVALTLVYRYFDRLNLRVEAYWMPVLASNMQPFIGRDRINVEVTNRSRTATTEVTMLALQSNHRKTFGDDGLSRWTPDSELPITLGPGQKASRSFLAQRIGNTINTAAPDMRWVQGVAESGHKTVVGKRRRDLVKKLQDYAIQHATPSRKGSNPSLEQMSKNSNTHFWADPERIWCHRGRASFRCLRYGVRPLAYALPQCLGG